MILRAAATVTNAYTYTPFGGTGVMEYHLKIVFYHPENGRTVHKDFFVNRRQYRRYGHKGAMVPIRINTSILFPLSQWIIDE